MRDFADLYDKLYGWIGATPVENIVQDILTEVPDDAKLEALTRQIGKWAAALFENARGDAGSLLFMKAEGFIDILTTLAIERTRTRHIRVTGRPMPVVEGGSR